MPEIEHNEVIVRFNKDDEDNGLFGFQNIEETHLYRKAFRFPYKCFL